MLERASAIHTLGLERAGAHVRGVVLYYHKRRVVCEEFFLLDAPQEEDELAPLYMTEQGKALQRQAQRSLVVTATDSMQTVVRQLEVKLKRESDIDAVLPFQVEPLLPFAVDEAHIDRVIVEWNSEGALLTILAVRNDHLQRHIDEWKALGVEPEVVGAAPQALAAFAQTFITTPNNEPLLLVHMGYQTTCCALVRQGKLLAAQSYKGGVHDLLAAYERDSQLTEEAVDHSVLASLDYAQLDTNKHPQLNSTVTQLQREAVRTAFGLAKYAHIGDVSAVVIIGEGSLYPSLASSLAAAIGKPLLPVEAPPRFGLDTKDLNRLALPVGLALTALPKNSQQVNFRQGLMAYPNPWKRLRWPLALTLGLCALLVGATYLFGQTYLEWRYDGLRQSYVDLLADLKRDYNDVEKRVSSSIGTEASLSIAPKELSLTAVDQRLNFLEKEVSTSPDTIALFPNVPRVSDVLAWLSSYPQLQLSEDKEAKKTAIQLENFNYRILKRPDISKPKEHYQAQVEFEFTSNSPRAARLFYDSLIAPNAMIDPKGEVKWTAANNKYRVAFFLKDRTIYPNP